MTDDATWLRRIARRDEKRAHRYYKSLIRLRDQLDDLANEIDDLITNEGKNR